MANWATASDIESDDQFTYTSGLICKRNTCFPAHHSLDGLSLAVVGAGHAKFLTMDVYTAVLYAQTDKPRLRHDAILDDVPKCLVIHYHRPLKKELIARTAERQLRKNPEIDLMTIKERLLEFHAAYRDVKAGDRYALEYSKSKGTRLILNGVEQIAVPGQDFAKAYFEIWLSKHPLDKGLRNALLKDM